MCFSLLSCEQKSAKSTEDSRVEVKSSPKTVEDSANTIIERANINLKDSGKQRNKSEKNQPN